MKSVKFNIFISILIIIISLIYCINSSNISKYEYEITLTKLNIYKEIKKNEKFKVNGNNILDMNEPHYFLIKHSYFKYNEPVDFLYYSTVTNSIRKAKVLLPKKYDNKKEYPILFLLHGHEGNENSWIKKRAHILVQNLNYFENSRDKIVVFVNSRLKDENEEWYLDYIEDVKAFDKTEDEIKNSLLPSLSSKYKISGNSEDRAIAGLSLGGRNALSIGFDTDLNFGYIGAFSPEEVRYGAKKIPTAIDSLNVNNKSKYIEISTGKMDNDTKVGTSDIVEFLYENGIKYNYYELEGGHEAKVWQNSLYNFLKRWK